MKSRQFIFILLFISILSSFTFYTYGNNGSSDNSVNICSNEQHGSYRKIIQELYSCKEMPANELMIKAALLRLETPYFANTLERDGSEELYVNIDKTDCILFVESCLALVQSVKSGDTTYAGFCKNIQNLRYRDGVINGYPSRLHYTSEWLLQAQKNGLIKEISGDIAATALNQKFSFMTENYGRYKHLKDNPENINKIKSAEEYLNSHEYFYIPKDKIDEYASKIKNGDILGFCTSVNGLDLSHVGIAYWENGRLTFIHASMKAMKVIIEPKTLSEYACSGKSTIGIRVARPL